MGKAPVLARAALHFWEEPCISGTRGSGTVFFSGCNLGCVYCQNYEISRQGRGIEVDPGRLREIYFELIGQGAHNINLVTPTHFLEPILESLREPLPVPVAWNCSGYESVESLKRLEGKVQIYMPDLKYLDAALADRYSGAPDYPQRAMEAIAEMYRQTGDYKMDADGILRSGVLVRHLILPENIENTLDVMDYIGDTYPGQAVLFSLMSQYVPCGRAAQFAEINRPLTQQEYDRVESYLRYGPITSGYIQDTLSASEAYIPDFHFQGVLPAEKQ